MALKCERGRVRPAGFYCSQKFRSLCRSNLPNKPYEFVEIQGNLSISDVYCVGAWQLTSGCVATTSDFFSTLSLSYTTHLSDVTLTKMDKLPEM